jgi:predicted O-methyltransferase YrrM
MTSGPQIPLSPDYEFTNQWFSGAESIWRQIFDYLQPTRMLEIGSYEGQSACFLIETSGLSKAAELHCIDTWKGGIEHAGIDMNAVERRFLKNTALAIGRAIHPVDLKIHKVKSDFALAQLFVPGYENYFDFIYVDGSHQAPDVLADAVL